jgi:hypothetical protein
MQEEVKSLEDEAQKERIKRENKRAQIKHILRDKLGIKEIRTLVMGESKRS